MQGIPKPGHERPMVFHEFHDTTVEAIGTISPEQRYICEPVVLNP